MSSKEEILNKLRNNKVPLVEKPKVQIKQKQTENIIQDFKEALKASAGEAIELKPEERIVDVVKRLFPDAKRLVSALPDMDQDVENPDLLDDARKLQGVDVGIVNGCFSVAENGAVWIKQDIRHKGLYFISEALVIVIPKNRIVTDMHQAYRQPEVTKGFEYGCFMSGPSKTADIEQALVIGAHGPRSVKVILV